MDWEIYDGQLQRGPMPEAAVFDAIRGGLPRNAYVRQAGASEWVPVETHPLFAVAIQHRRVPNQWPPPAAPPPPALIGAPQPAAPVVSEVERAMPYAVAGPNAGQAARRKLVGRGCLVQAAGVTLLLGAGFGLYSAFLLAAVAAVGGVGLVLLLVGGLLDLKWVCSLCQRPVDGKAALMCPTCRATFT